MLKQVLEVTSITSHICWTRDELQGVFNSLIEHIFKFLSEKLPVLGAWWFI
jgi:hypothetical protein